MELAKIKSTAIEDADIFALNHKLWGSDFYDIPVYAQIAFQEQGFLVKFTVKEKNPRREQTEHLSFVHEDSCVEFFVNFLPEHSDHYINFEVNAAGAMNVAFRTDRHNCVPLTLDEINSFQITPEIHNDFWSVQYTIGYDFIKKYYPGFDIADCDYIIGNLYKCGDKTARAHYVTYFKVDTEQPDYHRPEYFGKLWLEKGTL